MFCQENATGYLRELGYCVVRFPKSDVAPLLLLSKAGRTLDRFGQLDTVLVGDGSVPLPEIARHLPAASISGRSSSALRLGIGLSVLGDVLAAMGCSPIGLEAAYAKAKRISFEFRDVVEDRIEVAALDRYLSGADLNTHTTTAARLLESDDLYVVTSTLRTDRIRVSAWDEAEELISLDLPEIQQAVGATIDVQTGRDGERHLTYVGPYRLVFGFQAYRLRYVDGDYRALEVAGRVSMRGPGDTGGSDLLDAGAPFVRIADQADAR